MLDGDEAVTNRSIGSNMTASSNPLANQSRAWKTPCGVLQALRSPEWE
jgi:hypothetical protein